jgi:hypothetical protein
MLEDGVVQTFIEPWKLNVQGLFLFHKKSGGDPVDRSRFSD